MGGKQKEKEERSKRGGRFRRGNNSLEDPVIRNKKVEKMIKDRIRNKGFTGTDFMEIDSDDDDSQGKMLPNAALNTAIDWHGKRAKRYEKTLSEDLEAAQYSDDQGSSEANVVEDEDELASSGSDQRRKKSLKGKRLVLEVDTGLMRLKRDKSVKNAFEDKSTVGYNPLLIRPDTDSEGGDDSDKRMKQEEATQEDLFKGFMKDTNPDKFTALTQV
jgi:hypothetical protein